MVRKRVFWGVIALSAVWTIVGPLGDVIDQVAPKLPWIGALIGVSEALFTAGVLTMAAAMGLRVGFNPMRWWRLRGQIRDIAFLDHPNPLFWVGFWVNVVGAVGSGLIVTIAVLTTMPPLSWGLSLFGFADLSLTFIVRREIVLWIRQAESVPAAGS